MALDVNRDGKVDFYYTGFDSNHDGVPDAVQGIGPIAAVGVDTTRDGRGNYLYVGLNSNQDGIPDTLQRGGPTAVPPPMQPHMAIGNFGNPPSSYPAFTPVMAGPPLRRQADRGEGNGGFQSFVGMGFAGQ